MRKFILALPLLLLPILFSPPPARATWGAPYLQCQVAGLSCLAGAPQTCVSSGDMLIIFYNGYGNGTTVTSITASDSVDTYTNQFPDQGGGKHWIGVQFYVETLFTTVASTTGCRTFTVTVGGSPILNSLLVYAVHNTVAISAGSLFDCSAANTFTTNSATITNTGTCTAANTNDIGFGMASCNDSSTDEFTANAPGGGWTVFSGAPSAIDSFAVVKQNFTTSGNKTTQFASAHQTCVFSGGVYGVIGLVMLKSPDGSSSTTQPCIFVICKLHQPKIPWDDRKRRLEVV